MNEYKRLKDVFKLDTPNAVPAWADWTDKGVFTRLKVIAPWSNTVDEKQLNDLYALSRQEKILSPLGVGVYFDMQYAPGYTLSGGSAYIANLAYTKFSEKWTRLWELRNTEYDPLENYRMTETGGDTNTRTGSVTHSDTGTVTDTHTGTDTLTKTGEETHSKAGKEKLTKTGSEILEKSGEEILTKSGKEILEKKGKEILTKDGEEILTKDGAEEHSFIGTETTTNTVTSNNTSTNNSVFGFNSGVDAVPSDTSAGTQNGLSNSALSFSNDRQNIDLFDGRTDTTSYDGRTDTTEFDGRKDISTFDERKDTASFDGRKDTTSYDSRVDTAEFEGRVDTVGFTDREDVQTKDLTDTQTRSLFGGDTYNNLKDTGTHTLSRYGNIGVTTSEQMAMSELELWQVFDFFEIVFKDIDSILLLDIY